MLNFDVERIHLPESSLEPSCETVSHFTFLGMGITLLICIGCRLSVLLEFILLPMGLHEQFFKLIICDMKGSKSYFILSWTQVIRRTAKTLDTNFTLAEYFAKHNFHVLLIKQKILSDKPSKFDLDTVAQVTFRIVHRQM